MSKVRFEYIDVTGKIIDQFVPDIDYSNLTNITTACKATAYYKLDLDTDLRGLTRNTALKADLYVVYNDNAQGTGSERKLKLQVTLQDCMNCGAKTTNGGWLNFMCQNLGANNAIDPFTYTVGNADGSGGTLGWLYQWGRPSDNHQLRNSGTTTTLATTNEPLNGGLFITPTSSNPGDWRSGAGETSRWGNGTQDIDPPKAANDPCPPGWKVPSQKQWGSIFSASTTSGLPSIATANTWTWTGNGYMVGDALFLPAGGNRFYNSGSLENLGSMVGYWSSTIGGNASVVLWSSMTSVNVNSNALRSAGMAVRCVEEDMRGICVLPVITGTSTQNQNSTLFTSKFFTVTATGDDLTYQWYEGTVVGTGNPIGGATNPTFSYSPTSVGTVTFYCEVTASTCATSVASILFTITTP